MTCFFSSWLLLSNFEMLILILNISSNSFRCYEMEKRLKTPDLFKFPFFEAICWFVAKNLLETLKGN